MKTSIIILVIFLVSCKYPEHPKPINKKSLKMLFVGNSISEDMSGALAFIKKFKEDFDFTIAVAYKGGAPIKHYCEYFDNDKVYPDSQYHVLKSEGDGKWQSFHGEDYTVKKMLLKEKWDIITLQQASPDCDNIDTIIKDQDPQGRKYNVQGLIERIKSIIKYEFKLGWIMIPVRPTKYLPDGDYIKGHIDQEKMNESYKLQVNVCKTLLKEYPFDFVIPVGTAFMNAFNAGISKIQDPIDGSTVNWTADGVHMREGLPKLLETYMLLLQYYDLFKVPIDILEDRTDFSWDDLDEYHVIGRRHRNVRRVFGMNERNKVIIRKSAIAAYKNPWEKTPIH